MQHTTRRGSHQKQAELDPFVDPGHEPPLSVDGQPATLVDRRQVSLRWYCGIVLTGVCGALLMGGAAFVALDGEASFAATPQRADTIRSATASLDRSVGVSRKGDRLPTMGERRHARHLMRVSTTVQVGEREVVRIRPFVRVATNLALSTSDLSVNIPPYNPTRILVASASGITGSGADQTPAAADADFSFVMRDLAPVLARTPKVVAVPTHEVMTQVAVAAGTARRGLSGPVLTGTSGPGRRLAYAVDEIADIDPYAGFEARIVPENITLIPRTSDQTTGGTSWTERIVTARSDDTLAAVLGALGATKQEAQAILAAAGVTPGNDALREGQQLQVLLAPTGPGRVQPLRVIVLGTNGPELIVARSDTGRYIAIDVPRTVTSQVAADRGSVEQADGVPLYESLYETALRNQMPRDVIETIVRIHSNEIDFQRKVQPGDSFELLYPGEEDGNGLNELLFTSLTIGGETQRYYRFQTPDDGMVGYYDENGRSPQRFLVRKPIETGVMSSGYGMRRHPVLGGRRMHSGVDWAAPRGAPIYAAGNGVIERIGWQNGNGNYIRIRHASGYNTAYSHLSGYARGLTVGSHVRQGQLIGYVGSTGLSTGPNLHYEVMVNGRFVDPMRIRVPRERTLDGSILADFERERDKINSIMNRAPVHVADESPWLRGTLRSILR